MSMNLDQAPAAAQRSSVASPQLVAANHILALSSAELQALIQRELAGNYVHAQARAEALLRKLLDRSEHLQLRRCGYLEVASRTHPGRSYRIPAHGGNVHVYENGQAVSRLCVGPVNALPEADVILVHKLLIEADEEVYLATANHFPVPRF